MSQPWTYRKKVKIHSSSKGWLKGYSGGVCEWTKNEKAAELFLEEDATTYLHEIRKILHDVMIRNHNART
jgi:hypothetical protein